MTPNKTNTKSLHILANKIIAVLYAGLACWAIWMTSRNTNNPGIVFALPLLIMAIGHFMYKEWALVISSVHFAGLAVYIGLMVFTGLTPFDEAVPDYAPDLYVLLIRYFIFIVMPALLMVANFYFYRKLGKMSSTAIKGSQSATAYQIKASGVFVFANRIIAVAYMGSACLVLWNFFVGNDRTGLNLFAYMLSILLALTMAAGHFKYQEWALKLSGAIGLLALIQVIELLINGNKGNYGPKMYVQAMLFTLLAMLGLLMMWNFYFYRKLGKSSRTTIRED